MANIQIEIIDIQQLSANNINKLEMCSFPLSLAMLTSGLRETDQEEPIEIQGVDAGAGELLIQYIYTGEILLDHQVGSKIR